MSLRILHIASEVAPFTKTGGLGDVAAALPRALAAMGEKVAIVTPRYRIDPERYGFARRLKRVPVTVGPHHFELGILEGRIPSGRGEVQVWMIEHPLYDRAGLYNENNVDYPDNALRFALLSRAADVVARSFGFAADVIHGHDWQAGLALLYARRDPARQSVKTVFTIHNLAFMGLYPPGTVRDLGIGDDLFTPDGIEFYNQVSLLKAGLQFADRITTVSPRYAQEIQTSELGYGLEGLLHSKSNRLVGILNGIDNDVWNPKRDPGLAANYDVNDPSGKRVCKAALQRLVGLPERARTPLVGAVSRLTHQKGLDLVVPVLELLLAERDMQMIVLGSGEAQIEDQLKSLARRFPAKMVVRIGYDEPLSHRIYGGCDLFVMPSRYEPCGLGQMYALRYGAVPIVRATGGLDDTVVDYDPRSKTGTGFKFSAFSPESLGAAWRRALTTYGGDDHWQKLVCSGMCQDFSWAVSARSYQALYRSISRH